MESAAGERGEREHEKRKWSHLRKVLERSGPFCHPDFEPSPEILRFTMTSCKVLVVGAGGLGCELLKSLALMGFRRMHVVDMDTIELSNLNRQFLFRRKDIGLSKAQVAAAFINERVAGCEVVPHYCAIQDLDESFYSRFNVVVCGLDSVVARRWLNGMLLSLLNFNRDGAVDQNTVIPLVDGGTEGFKGNARVVLPGMTACVECTLDFYPPQVTYPLCTIANTPRLPEHCIEYVKVLQWPKENPWGTAIDGDDPQHVNWIYEKAQERADRHRIHGVTYRLTHGVVKNIIPAVASTNAIIAAACATEVFKLATSCCTNLNNYLLFNDVDGVYTYTLEAERKPDCLACGSAAKILRLEDPRKVKLKELIEKLCDGQEYQMKNPGLTTSVNGKNKTLYMSTVASIEERTRDNLNKTLFELGIVEDAEILVADATAPNAIALRIKYASSENSENSQMETL